MMKNSVHMVGLTSIALLMLGCIIHDHGSNDAQRTQHSSTADSGGCQYDTECYDEEYCGEAGFCYPIMGCHSHRECGVHELCAAGLCTDTRECTHDNECGTGLFCNEGSCELIGPCERDLDCPTAMFCTFDQLCEVLPAGQCVIDEDCFDNELCSASGFCY